MAHFFGIDIGGSNIKIGLVDSEYGLLEKVKYPTKNLRKGNDFVKDFSSILKTEFENHPEVEEIGIGVPGGHTADHSPMILTNTRLRRLPSNSP